MANPFPQCIQNNLSTICEVQFKKDVADMLSNGPLAHVQIVPDLPVGQSLRQELHHW